MEYKRFEAIINLMVVHQKKMDDLYELNIDIFDFNNTQEVIIDSLWSEILTEDGKDWLDWFLYEKRYIQDGKGRKDLKAWKHEKEVCKNLKGLYNFLKTENYFKICQKK